MKISAITKLFKTTDQVDVIDLTGELVQLTLDQNLDQGVITVFTPGSTAAVTTIEYESGVLKDLTEAIERLAPRGMDYAHDARWGDGNGYSHVRAALLGPSLTVPVIDGRPALGTWQQVVLIDFDNRPRERRVILQAMGR